MKHLGYLKIINLIEVPLNILIGIGMIVAGVVPVVLADNVPPEGRIALWSTLIIMVVLGLLFFVMAALFFVAARKIVEGRGRILQTVLAVLCIGSVPLGTAYGAYALWICWMNEETKNTFA